MHGRGPENSSMNLILDIRALLSRPKRGFLGHLKACWKELD